MITKDLLDIIKDDFDNTLDQFPLFGIVDYEYRGDILLFVYFENLQTSNKITIKSIEVYSREWDPIETGIDKIKTMILDRINNYIQKSI